MVTIVIVGDRTIAMSDQQEPSNTAKIGEPGAMSTLHISMLPRAAHLLPVDFYLRRESVGEQPPLRIWQENPVNFPGAREEVARVTIG